MIRYRLYGLMLTVLLMVPAFDAHAQVARSRSPERGETTSAANDVPRDPRFPFAGEWRGTRTMPEHAGPVAFRFTVTDGSYAGASVHPDGGRVPHRKLVASAAGLTWEQPNSGGGTWVYNVRLAGADSMVGTLVLRDPPSNLTPAPTGTMVLTRQRPAARNE